LDFPNYRCHETQRGCHPVRDSTYARAKLVLHIYEGIFIDFIPWKSPSTLQGVQNKFLLVFISSSCPFPLPSSCKYRASQAGRFL
jgi:hypothetical protein